MERFHTPCMGPSAGTIQDLGIVWMNYSSGTNTLTVNELFPGGYRLSQLPKPFQHAFDVTLRDLAYPHISADVVGFICIVFMHPTQTPPTELHIAESETTVPFHLSRYPGVAFAYVKPQAISGQYCTLMIE